MKITILAAGNVGSSLGEVFGALGHSITFGVRTPGDDKYSTFKGKVKNLKGLSSFKESVKDAEVVIVTTPWLATEEVVKACGDLTGKILIDATNPISLGAEELKKGLLLGFETSAAEEVAKWSPGAKVVKCFNTTGWQNMINSGGYTEKPSMFYCGDDTDAKSKVKELIEGIGFDPIDCGDLQKARLLEPTAMLWINLAYAVGLGPNIALKLMKR
jgi:predicted dinucleotide-binding enzyme